MELTEARLNALEELVDELTKSSPEERLVQSYMKEAGIKDPGDQIQRMQLVLQELQFVNSRAQGLEIKE